MGEVERKPLLKDLIPWGFEISTPPGKAWETHGEPFPVVGMGDMLPVQVPDPGGVVGSLPEGEGGAHMDAIPISYG